jgi:hypothetical protein
MRLLIIHGAVELKKDSPNPQITSTGPNKILFGFFAGDAKAYGWVNASFSPLERDIRRGGALFLYWDLNAFTPVCTYFLDRKWFYK